MGAPARLERCDGVVSDLATDRWRAVADPVDGRLLDRCAGPTIDLGCGPGRLVLALLHRGVPALGVDRSAAASRLCRRRGAPMVRGDVFDALPGEGTWGHALLADGNIGIGGDPLRLLSRAAALLRPGGTVLVEADPRPGLWRGTARVRTAAGRGAPVLWACAGVDALTDLAGPAGMRATAVVTGMGRMFVELTVRAAA